MISRYTLPAMSEIWSEEAKFKRWLAVEIAVVQVREAMNSDEVPMGTSAHLHKHARVDVARIDELEATTNHDVIAFITQVAETCGEPGRHIHFGMTSSDVVDTALGLALRDSGKLLLEKLDALIATSSTLAQSHRHTLMMGRTHGMHAEPTTFGIKVAGWVDELRRNRERLHTAVERVSCGKISGAVGTYTLLGPEIESAALHELGLHVASHSTQVVPRDRHAEFITALALLGGGLERIATEIRHGQRTELGELQEPFGKGQRGSSAMPHKKNPIMCERICGGARMLRGYAVTAMENISLWMERDISHSSTERVILPDACLLADYLLYIMNRVLAGVVVDEQRMKKTVTGAYDLHLSQKILSALVSAGRSRDEAYSLVQAAAFAARERRKSLLTIATELDWWGLPEGARSELSTSKPARYWRTIYKRAGVLPVKGGRVG